MRLYHGRVVGVNHRKEAFNKIMTVFNTMPIDQVDFHLELKAEPENPYDENAVMVILGQKGGPVEHVGYIPKENNRKLLQEGLENLETSIIQFNRFDGKVVGLDIEVNKK